MFACCRHWVSPSTQRALRLKPRWFHKWGYPKIDVYGWFGGTPIPGNLQIGCGCRLSLNIFSGTFWDTPIRKPPRLHGYEILSSETYLVRRHFFGFWASFAQAIHSTHCFWLTSDSAIKLSKPITWACTTRTWGARFVPIDTYWNYNSDLWLLSNHRCMDVGQINFKATTNK